MYIQLHVHVWIRNWHIGDVGTGCGYENFKPLTEKMSDHISCICPTATV